MRLPEPNFLKKVYFPGLISIIVLPIACIVYLYFYQAKYMMDVSWFDKNGIERLNTHFTQKIDFEKFRTYKNLYLTANNDHEISEIKKLTDALVSNSDFKNGICIFLTSKTQYQQLVTALDITMKHNTLGIIPYYNRIFIFNDNRPVKASTVSVMPCAGVNTYSLANDVISITPSTSVSEILKADFSELSTGIVQFWPALIPLMGMIFFWQKRNKYYWSIN